MQFSEDSIRDILHNNKWAQNLYAISYCILLLLYMAPKNLLSTGGVRRCNVCVRVGILEKFKLYNTLAVCMCTNDNTVAVEFGPTII